MAKLTRAYGIGSPLQEVFPKPIVAQRAPTTADVGYEIGQSWVDNSADASYVLTSVAGGSATWSSTANPAINQAGLQSFDGSGTLNGRTLTAGSAALTVTNGDGVSGDPTVDVATFTRKTSTICTNIGFSYSAGVFTIHGADGNSLSVSNPGYVTLPSRSTRGEVTTYTLTSNFTFEDAAGTSDITGNTFGTVAGSAYATDIPFFVYFAANTSDVGCVPFLSRLPGASRLCQTANIGAPDDAVADNAYSFWCFENIDETTYSGVPCVRLGSFRMQKNGSDDWTVQSLTSGPDGVGGVFTTIDFSVPTGAFGAATGAYLTDNGGTAPIFTTQLYQYQLHEDNSVSVDVFLSGDGGTDGAGAVSAQLVLPFPVESTNSIDQNIGSCRVLSAVTGSQFVQLLATDTSPAYAAFLEASGSSMQNSDFSNGSRSIRVLSRYRIYTGY